LDAVLGGDLRSQGVITNALVKVEERTARSFQVIAQFTDGLVAVVAQNPSNPTGVVIVIHTR